MEKTKRPRLVIYKPVEPNPPITIKERFPNLIRLLEKLLRIRQAEKDQEDENKMTW